MPRPLSSAKPGAPSWRYETPEATRMLLALRLPPPDSSTMRPEPSTRSPVASWRVSSSAPSRRAWSVARRGEAGRPAADDHEVVVRRRGLAGDAEPLGQLEHGRALEHAAVLEQGD